MSLLVLVTVLLIGVAVLGVCFLYSTLKREYDLNDLSHSGDMQTQTVQLASVFPLFHPNQWLSFMLYVTY